MFEPEARPTRHLRQVEMPASLLTRRTNEPQPPYAGHRHILSQEDQRLAAADRSLDLVVTKRPQVAHGGAIAADGGLCARSQGAGPLELPDVQTGVVFHQPFGGKPRSDRIKNGEATEHG
jgi:hypothetical protein